MRVGVTKASSSERELSGVIKAATLVPVTSLKDGREMFAAGKLDAYATNKAI